MEDKASKLLNDFNRGRLSRRQLLQALGIAAATASMPRITFAQGSCGGDRAGTPACNTTPMKAPFEPTGWKTVLLDHFKLQVAELDKEAAYYQALMGWKPRSNDGKKIVLDIGNIGSVVMRGGLPLPPPTPTTSQTPLAALAASAQTLATTAAAMAAAEAARGGNGAGGRGAGGNGGGRGNAPRRAIWDGFCFGIEPWDTAKVETELKKRDLNPVPDHDSKAEFYSFHVKDPD